MLRPASSDFNTPLDKNDCTRVYLRDQCCGSEDCGRGRIEGALRLDGAEQCAADSGKRGLCDGGGLVPIQGSWQDGNIAQQHFQTKARRKASNNDQAIDCCPKTIGECGAHLRRASGGVGTQVPPMLDDCHGFPFKVMSA